MEQEYEHLSNEEKLKAENEFLKMKMMLEQGAVFGKGTEKEISPTVENDFLQYIIAFEKQAVNPKYIKVYDKIKRPTHFKPVDKIADEDIESAWEELAGYMNKYDVRLGVCSPNISDRELYRFATEELFNYDTNDIHYPGMKTYFTYDEFYPDPYYENTQAATDECIMYILQQDPMEWTHHFRKENLRLNNHHPITQEKLKEIVNQFKAAYESLEISQLTDTECIVDQDISTVTGMYELTATTAIETIQLSGNWRVSFERDEDLGYWYINAVEIEEINF